MELNEITGKIVDAAFHIHTQVGPGMLESAYQKIYVYELRKRGLRVAEQVPVDIQWEDMVVPKAFRVDILVEDRVVVELKAAAATLPEHRAQLLTYLRLMNRRVGLLVNFGEKNWSSAVNRIVNNLDSPDGDAFGRRSRK